MIDRDTTVGTLKKKISDFRDSRGWLRYDTPRSLAISISIEAAELLEHFQWKNDERIQEALKHESTKDEISNELADVLIYCLGFSDVTGIDVSEAIERKLQKNGEKYPVSELGLTA